MGRFLGNRRARDGIVWDRITVRDAGGRVPGGEHSIASTDPYANG